MMNEQKAREIRRILTAAALERSDHTKCGCREAACPHEPVLGWPSLGAAYSEIMNDREEAHGRETS